MAGQDSESDLLEVLRACLLIVTGGCRVVTLCFEERNARGAFPSGHVWYILAVCGSRWSGW